MKVEGVEAVPGQGSSAAPGTALGFSPSAQFMYRGGMALGRASGWALTPAVTEEGVLLPPGTEVLCSAMSLSAVFICTAVWKVTPPVSYTAPSPHLCFWLVWGLPEDSG